jgi:hypothetical protein
MATKTRVATNGTQRLGGVTGAGFMPGQSGNPSGRPKALMDVVEAARAHTVLAIKTLADIAQDEKKAPAARVAASAILLDRGWGRALQRVEGAVIVTDELDLSQLDASEFDVFRKAVRRVRDSRAATAIEAATAAESADTE